MVFVDDLIEALTGYFKADSELQETHANIKVDRHVGPDVMLKLFLQNNRKTVLVMARLFNGEATRFQNNSEGLPLALSRVEVYEVTVWLLDTPHYRLNKDLVLLDKVTEKVCQFFYNHPVFGSEKTVKPMNTTVGQQLRYCNQVLVTRLNEALSDYKQN